MDDPFHTLVQCNFFTTNKMWRIWIEIKRLQNSQTLSRLFFCDSILCFAYNTSCCLGFKRFKLHYVSPDFDILVKPLSMRRVGKLRPPHCSALPQFSDLLVAFTLPRIKGYLPLKIFRPSASSDSQIEIFSRWFIISRSFKMVIIFYNIGNQTTFLIGISYSYFGNGVHNGAISMNQSPLAKFDQRNGVCTFHNQSRFLQCRQNR